MRGLMALVILVLLYAATVSAQTPTLSWTQGNVSTAAQAQGFTYRLTVTPFGAPPLTPIVLTGVSCTGVPANCTAPLPAAGVLAAITGAKSTLTATDTSGINPLESGASVPFSPGAAVPTGLKVGG